MVRNMGVRAKVAANRRPRDVDSTRVRAKTAEGAHFAHSGSPDSRAKTSPDRITIPEDSVTPGESSPSPSLPPQMRMLKVSCLGAF
jgi:hypothetical protein